ncbi:pitrilysin family protein [Bacteroides sp.]|uniref:M16 family metallopeptidase n=1 Tax=Bacteroides sp. TaxID=29523 RepID=UPI0025862AF7|nr:pitrilysin family protein [Bacteroides sp.]
MNRAIQPTIQPLSELHLPLPKRRRLSNGIPITIVKVGSQEVVRLDILFKAGTWCQSQKLQALFTNRMLREGTNKFSAKEIAEKLDFYGAWLELSCGAAYSCITLYSLSRYFPQTLGILESMIKEPIFDKDKLETVKEMNIQQFMVNQDRVDFLAHRRLLNMLLGDTHPYGKLTEKEDYSAITSDLLHEFFHKHFHSNNCHIFLAGDATEANLKEVEKAFGLKPFGAHENKPTECPTPIFTPSKEDRGFIEKEGSVQSAVCLGMPTLMRTHTDYLKFRVVLTILGGYFGSRLVTNIREEKGYTYYIGADMTHYPFSSFLIIHTECDNEYVKPLIAEIHHEIDRLQQEPISEEELLKVKNYMIGELCRNYESAFAVADAWMFAFTTGVDDDYFQLSLEAIKAVTVAEVQELSQKYLCKENLKEVIAGEKIL